MTYYGARLLVVCLVDDARPRKKVLCDYAFVLIRATGYEEAFEGALKLGKQREHTYKNPKGQRVRWSFIQVEEIKKLGRKLNGVEVGSLLDVWEDEAPLRFSKRFHPERVRPLFT
ncbi:MAG TPA: DUF4288 domain-containing protein [Isosphaeraceae bacterium]|jgi:hypothetical protein|nr:DUF4288 domain-containing protein [Isosphaeraceae bacterium]